MIRIETKKPTMGADDSWNYSASIYEEVDNGITRTRWLGVVWYWEANKGFDASVNTIDTDGLTSRRRIAHTPTLPAAIQSLIDFHKMTDYQFAPWPSLEEDEE